MSNVFSTYISGFKLLFYKWKAWGIIFLANIIFALLIAFPFHRLLQSLAAHSEAPLGGLAKFDIAFIADLVNNYGPEVNMLIGQFSVLATLYIILNIFLAGGLIESYVHLFQKHSFGNFLSNCAKHFWRLFRVALYFLATQIFVVFVLFKIYSNLGLSPFELESEGVLISRTRIMLIIFVALFAWIDMVHEYVKVKMVVNNQKGIILPQLVGIKFFVLRHFFPILGVFLLCTLTFLLLLGAYSMINDIFTMSSMGSIIVGLLIGQVYLFFRVGSRLLFTATATDYMRSKDWGN